MTLVAANVRVAVTGAAYVAPLETALPADAMAVLPAAHQDVGYIHEDGVTQSISTDVTDIKAWQNGDVVRKIQTSHDLTFQFKMIETNETTLRLYYADKDATASAVKVTGAQSEHNVWVLDVLDGDKVVRVVLPDAQITERGDITYKNDEAIGYEITLTAYPVAGVKAYLYMGEADAA